MPGLPVRPIETPSCILDGQLKETLWRLWAEPPLAPLHPHIFIRFFFTHWMTEQSASAYPLFGVISVSREVYLKVQSQCFLDVFYQFPAELFHSINLSTRGTRFTRWAAGLPPPPKKSQDLTVSASVSKFSSCGSSSHDLDPSQTRVMNQMTLDFGWQNQTRLKHKSLVTSPGLQAFNQE